MSKLQIQLDSPSAWKCMIFLFSSKGWINMYSMATLSLLYSNCKTEKDKTIDRYKDKAKSLAKNLSLIENKKPLLSWNFVRRMGKKMMWLHEKIQTVVTIWKTHFSSCHVTWFLSAKFNISLIFFYKLSKNKLKKFNKKSKISDI